jgi:HEAT repeat protein
VRYPGWRPILSCILGLTSSGLLQFSLTDRAFGLESQKSGQIQACIDKSIDLSSPKLTDSDLKSLLECDSKAIPQLLEALKAQDWKVKVIAAHALGLFGKRAQSTIPALSNLIQDENADVRFVAAQALGDIGTEAVVPALTKALQDKDENVRVSAADAFLKIVSVAKPAKPVLIAALWDGNWFVRSKVASTVLALGLDSSDITELAKDEVRIASLVSLFPKIYSPTLNKPQDVPLFFIAASHQKDPKVRESVASVLGRISYSRPGLVHLDLITNTLLNLMQDREVKVRRRVAQALGDLIYGFEAKAELVSFEKKLQSIERGNLPYSDEISRIEAALVNAIQDPDPIVRRAAIVSLADLSAFKSNPQKVILILLTALQDREPSVRQSAAKSLNSWYIDMSNQNQAILSRRISSSLIKAFIDEDANVRNEAMNINNIKVLFPALIEILERGKVGYEVRQSVIFALWSNHLDYGKSEKVIDLLSENLQDSNFGVRQQAAIALNEIGKFESKSAALLFLEGLSSKEPSIRLDAIIELNKICSKNLKSFHEAIGICPDIKPMLPILMNILRNDIKPLQYSAAFTIAKIDYSQEDVINFFQEILLTSHDYKLRSNAAAVLEEMNSIKAKLALIKSSSYYDKNRRYALYDEAENAYIGLNPNDVELLFKALEDENTRFMASKSISSFLNNPDISDIISRDIISRLSQLLRENSTHYKNFSVLDSIFKLKNQDLRRSVVYTLGESKMRFRKPDHKSEIDNEITDVLINVVNDKTENPDIRWMAATKEYQCQFPHIGRGITGFSFDRYASQCVYNYTIGYGAGLPELYDALRNLLSSPKK